MFLSETNFFYILLTTILYAADRRAWGQKECFFREYLCFLFSHCVESTRTDPFFADAARGLIMFWHDFEQGGGARAIVMFVVGSAEGVVSI
jgi:hypothetical protein